VSHNITALFLGPGSRSIMPGQQVSCRGGERSTERGRKKTSNTHNVRGMGWGCSVYSLPQLIAP